jgi:chromosome segregation ATPase
MKGKIDVVERDINKTVDELAGLKRKADKLEERYADIKTAIDVNRSKLKALQLKRAQKEMCIVAEGSEG